MIIKYWTGFSKRKNSTKQPTGGTDCTVVLKKDTSILQPTFIVSTIPDTVNYIQAFGRYYFVTDITRNINGAFELQCTVDELASYKSDIGAYTAFIDRSASNYDINISDEEVFSCDDIVQSEITQGDFLNGDFDINGCIVVTAVGKNGLRKYIMSMSQISDIVNPYFDTTLSAYFDPSNSVWQNVTDALQGIFCALGNPAQYIKSVMWFPLSLASGTMIPYFGFMAPSGGYSVGTAKDTANMGGAITNPSRYYNDFRDFDNRFTQATVYLPGVGVIPIDAKYLQKTLNFTYYIDINTGAANVALLADQSEIGSYSFQMGVNVPVGGMSGLNAGGGILQAASAALSGNVFGIKQGLINGINQTFQAPSNVFGGSGNAALWYSRYTVQISVTRLGSTGIPLSNYGRPLKEFSTISSLSGFVKCSGASISISGYDAERDAINSYLNSGFYYE